MSAQWELDLERATQAAADDAYAKRQESERAKRREYYPSSATYSLQRPIRFDSAADLTNESIGVVCSLRLASELETIILFVQGWDARVELANQLTLAASRLMSARPLNS